MMIQFDNLLTLNRVRIILFSLGSTILRRHEGCDLSFRAQNSNSLLTSNSWTAQRAPHYLHLSVLDTKHCWGRQSATGSRFITPISPASAFQKTNVMLTYIKQVVYFTTKPLCKLQSALVTTVQLVSVVLLRTTRTRTEELLLVSVHHCRHVSSRKLLNGFRLHIVFVVYHWSDIFKSVSQIQRRGRL